MKSEQAFANELIEFIYHSPTSFHAVLNCKNILCSSGFIELKDNEAWNIEKGGKYYVVKNGSALVAFVAGIGNIHEEGFKIIGAHTDSPTFRIKPYPEMAVENHYIKLNTESYSSSLILNTWLDRPLSAAGRVVLAGKDLLHPDVKLVNIKRPILIIPNLAIHMNRNMNSGMELNKQKDTLPLLAIINESLEKDNYLLNEIAKELNVCAEDILDFDLYLYEYEKGTVLGLNNEFISSSRLDDLAMVHAGLTALKKSKPSMATNVLACFDNEEVGSTTKQGANSNFLSNVLERIAISFGGGREDFFRALSKSFMISADLAHAVHPNVGEKHDPKIRPLINKGPVIKISASMSYTSDSDSASVYASICKKAGVPVQYFVNRSDEKGGTTIGPISSSHLDIRCVDVGTPVLSMHSIRELGGVFDHTYITKSFEEFYAL